MTIIHTLPTGTLPLSPVTPSALLFRTCTPDQLQAVCAWVIHQIDLLQYHGHWTDMTELWREMNHIHEEICPGFPELVILLEDDNARCTDQSEHEHDVPLRLSLLSGDTVLLRYEGWAFFYEEHAYHEQLYLDHRSEDNTPIVGRVAERFVEQLINVLTKSRPASPLF